MKNIAHNLMNKINDMNPRKPKTVTLIIFVIIAVVCAILNILTSPLLWVMIVIGFERLVWKLIFCKRLFENSLPDRILSFVRGVSVSLVGLMILLYRYPAAIITISLINSVLQIAAAILYLIQYRKSTVLSPIYLIDRALIGLLCLIIGLIVNSYAVAMVSIATITLIVPALILVQDKLLFEGKKRLHMY